MVSLSGREGKQMSADKKTCGNCQSCDIKRQEGFCLTKYMEVNPKWEACHEWKPIGKPTKKHEQKA
jgi:hypothetical protein